MVFPVRSATGDNPPPGKRQYRHDRKEPRQDRSKDKVKVELLSDSNGIVHMEFIPEGATVNKTRYKEIIGRLCDSIRRNRPELWRRKDWLLLHDDATAHRYVLVQEELVRQQATILPHSPYSPYLAHSIFFFVDFIRPKRSRLPEENPYGIFLSTCYSGDSGSKYQRWQK